MVKLKDFFRSNKTFKPPAAGIYQFKERSEGGESRLHLRIDGDGSGMLMVNASRVYHFNPTAAFMTYLVLHGCTEKQALASLTHSFRVNKSVARTDYQDIAAQIRLIISPEYERISTLIRGFTSLTTEEIALLKQFAKQANSDKLQQTVQFLEPLDDDELTALIPILASMTPTDQQTLLQISQTSKSSRLADLLDLLMHLPQSEWDKLRILEQGSPHDDGLEPIFDTILPFSKRDLSAPYRMDLALTYRCNNRCHHCYNPLDRQRNELDTQTWKTILDQLWDIGIPHIIFTGGEPTLRPDLPELIAHAESNGQITGINTNGRKLKDPELVKALVDAGLDHVQITIESHDEKIHDEMVNLPGAWAETTAGIRNVLNTRLYMMTNTTMLSNNYQNLHETLAFLADLGVPRVGLNALIYSGHGTTVGTGLSEAILPDLLVLAREMTQKNHQKLTWYTPTQYCNFDPVLFDLQTLGVKGCTAALYNMCIEPDGFVLPCQSFYTPLGNILHDPWESIWNHELALQLRNRSHVPEVCKECSLLAICGGGCPLAYRAGKIEPPRAIHFIDA